MQSELEGTQEETRFWVRHYIVWGEAYWEVRDGWRTVMTFRDEQSAIQHAARCNNLDKK